MEDAPGISGCQGACLNGMSPVLLGAQPKVGRGMLGKVGSIERKFDVDPFDLICKYQLTCNDILLYRLDNFKFHNEIDPDNIKNVWLKASH